MHATIIMEGRLVNDPEHKTGKNGDYCIFRFVVNTKHGNQDIASFYNCTANEYIANRMKKAGIKKGRMIEIIGNLALRPYSDFDTYDKNNRYRLMDMSARDCNRDGAALRFVAEKLSKQTSEVKILMIICDGQPNDDGYSGSAAEADLRGIKLEYARKGVKIYAAAIGEDRPRIERIYGDGYLDITNLQELPVMLTNLIVRSLPH